MKNVITVPCRLLFALLLIVGISTNATAGPEDMEVTTWNHADTEYAQSTATCDEEMNTNHFELAPGEGVEIDLDLNGCNEDQLGGFVFFGYRTTKNSSQLLTTRDNILLTLDAGNGEVVSESGSIYVENEEPTSIKLTATNMNHKKTITIRLRAKSGL